MGQTALGFGEKTRVGDRLRALIGQTLQKRQFVFIEGARFAKRIHLQKPQNLALADQGSDADGAHIHFPIQFVVGQIRRRLRVGKQKQRSHRRDVTIVNSARSWNITLVVIARHIAHRSRHESVSRFVKEHHRRRRTKCAPGFFANRVAHRLQIELRIEMRRDTQKRLGSRFFQILEPQTRIGRHPRFFKTRTSQITVFLGLTCVSEFGRVREFGCVREFEMRP